MYKKELDVCLNIIKKASEAILKIYQEGFDVKLKEDKSEVTIADLTSNKIICDELKNSFPSYAILSEETKDDLSRVNNDYCFIVDPLDGTKDFVNHTDTFAINIALSYKKEIVLGVISVPCKNIVYYGLINEGAYKIENGITSRIHTSNKLNDLTMLVSNFFFKDDSFNNNPYIKEIIPVGSSYKHCLIAEGKADFCIKLDNKTKEWDIAPSEIIIKEAGGFMSDYHGNKMFYNKNDVVNQNGFIILNKKENLIKFVR